MNILSIILLWVSAFMGARDGATVTDMGPTKYDQQIEAQSAHGTIAGPTTVIALEDTHFRPAK